jgi:hypothetical protein
MVKIGDSMDTKTRLGIYLLFLLALLLRPVYASEGGSRININALNPEISDVYVCAEWKYGGKEGRYRIVEAQHRTSEYMYIQWLANVSGKESSSVVPAKKVISTIGFRVKMNAPDIECDTQDGKNFFLYIVNGAGENIVTIDLKNKPGEYLIQNGKKLIEREN